MQEIESESEADEAQLIDTTLKILNYLEKIDQYKVGKKTKIWTKSCRFG